MKVQAQYGGAGALYTFDAPADTEVGDIFDERSQSLVIRAIGGDYSGPLRTLNVVNRVRPGAPEQVEEVVADWHLERYQDGWTLHRETLVDGVRCSASRGFWKTYGAAEAALIRVKEEAA